MFRFSGSLTEIFEAITNKTNQNSLQARSFISYSNMRSLQNQRSAHGFPDNYEQTFVFMQMQTKISFKIFNLSIIYQNEFPVL